jgi:hypothetical protein
MKLTVLGATMSLLLLAPVNLTHSSLSGGVNKAATLVTTGKLNSHIGIPHRIKAPRVITTTPLLLEDEESRFNQKREEEGLRDQVPVPCDTAASYLDHAVIDTRKLEGTHLIIIGRLGRGEKSGRLDRIRLSNVEEYVRRRGSGLKFVLAQGSKVEGLGRMEVYLAGRLLYIMPFETNAKGFCLPGREGW